jgi:hypothetical protein
MHSRFMEARLNARTAARKHEYIEASLPASTTETKNECTQIRVHKRLHANTPAKKYACTQAHLHGITFAHKHA